MGIKMKEINIKMPNRPEQLSGKGIKMDFNSLCGIQSGLESDNNIFSSQNTQIINNAPGLPKASMLLTLPLSLSLF